MKYLKFNTNPTLEQWQTTINTAWDISAQITWRGLSLWCAFIAIRLAIRRYLAKRNIVQTDITPPSI